MPRTISWCAVLLAAALVSGARAEEPKKDAPAKPPTFKAPKGWDAVEGPKTDIVQVAARFKSGEGEKAVAVVVLGSAGEGGGVLANVNRWRAQVGLEALDPKAAMEAVQEIKVDGLPAFRIDASTSLRISLCASETPIDSATAAVPANEAANDAPTAVAVMSEVSCARTEMLFARMPRTAAFELLSSPSM